MQAARLGAVCLIAVGGACGDNLAAIDAGADAQPSGLCDPLLQNCPGGEGCYWAGFGTFRCSEPGGLPLYHPCADIAQCSPGDGCHLDDRFDFYCTHYCDYLNFAGERDPRCEPHELCASWDGTIGICMGICDPREQPCPTDQGCYAVAGADLCYPVATPGAIGDPCLRPNDCVASTQCDDGTCRRQCDFEQFPGGSDPVCQGGEVCTGPFGSDVIGRCVLP